jgi:hypothetical protein
MPTAAGDAARPVEVGGQRAGLLREERLQRPRLVPVSQRFPRRISGLRRPAHADLHQGASTIDAQIGYDFKHGPLNGLSVYVQGKNLTNSAFVTYQNNDKNQVLNYETYGPTWLAGFTMKF